MRKNNMTSTQTTQEDLQPRISNSPNIFHNQKKSRTNNNNLLLLQGTYDSGSFCNYEDPNATHDGDSQVNVQVTQSIFSVNKSVERLPA